MIRFLVHKGIAWKKEMEVFCNSQVYFQISIQLKCFLGTCVQKKQSFVCILQYRQKLNRIFQLALLSIAEKIMTIKWSWFLHVVKKIFTNGHNLNEFWSLNAVGRCNNLKLKLVYFVIENLKIMKIELVLTTDLISGIQKTIQFL